MTVSRELIRRDRNAIGGSTPHLLTSRSFGSHQCPNPTGFAGELQ